MIIKMIDFPIIMFWICNFTFCRHFFLDFSFNIRQDNINWIVYLLFHTGIPVYLEWNCFMIVNFEVVCECKLSIVLLGYSRWLLQLGTLAWFYNLNLTVLEVFQTPIIFRKCVTYISFPAIFIINFSVFIILSIIMPYVIILFFLSINVNKWHNQFIFKSQFWYIQVRMI